MLFSKRVAKLMPSLLLKRAAKPKYRLFDNNDKLFKELLLDSVNYVEYGMGASTCWVLNNTNANIISVDTSATWINEVIKNNHSLLDRLTAHHIDLGQLRNWGYPISYDKRNRFIEYTDTPWQSDTEIDTVLIDGRFRVCCFLSVLKYSQEGTKIIFDDYVTRPHYHIVEKYAKREQESGRQCLFITPNKSTIDSLALQKDIDNFRHVFD